MWPQKKGLGLQLTYGVPGGGNIVVSNEDNPDVNIEFPQLTTPKLKKILQESRNLKAKQTNAYDYYDTNPPKVYFSQLKKMPKLPLPNDLISTYNTNSRLTNTINAYDPTFGSLIRFFYVRSNKRRSPRYRMVAFASGKEGSILEIAAVRPNKVVAHMETELPEFEDSVLLDLKSPIRQITSYDLVIADGSQPALRDFIMVRTQFNIYVLQCMINNNKTGPFASLKLVAQITNTQLNCKAFADCCFGPATAVTMMAIDIEGNIFIFSLTKLMRINIKKVDINPEYEDIYKSIYELLNWRKLFWVNSESVYVATRSSLIRVNLQQNTVDKIITAETWSLIQDIQTVEIENENMFILTTKEIIWVSLKDDTPRRIMTWKHFLNENDPSLKLTITKNESKFICLVYSQTSPIIMCFSFGIINNKPYCLSLPSLIEVSGSKVPIQSLAIEELDKSFYKKVFKHANPRPKTETIFIVYDLRLNLSINMNTIGYNERPIKHMKEPYIIDFKEYNQIIAETSVRAFNSQYFAKLSKSDLVPLLKEIIKTPEAVDDISSIQQFAFELGSGIERFTQEMNNRIDETIVNDKLVTCSSLLDLSTSEPPFAHDLEEFDTMLEQLMGHLNDNELEVINLGQKYISNFQELNGDINSSTVTELYNFLKDNYYSKKSVKSQTRSTSVKNFAILFITSLIKAKPSDMEQHYLNKVEETLNQASSSTRAILNDWDTFAESTEVDTLSSQTNFSSNLPSVPSINITSQDTSTQRRKGTRHKTDLRKRALRASQLPSQPQTPPVSQSTSQFQSQPLGLNFSSSQTSQIPSSPPLPPSSPTTASQSRYSQLRSSQPKRLQSQRSSQFRSSQRPKKKKRGF